MKTLRVHSPGDNLRVALAPSQLALADPAQLVALPISRATCIQNQALRWAQESEQYFRS